MTSDTPGEPVQHPDTTEVGATAEDRVGQAGGARASTGSTRPELGDAWRSSPLADLSQITADAELVARAVRQGVDTMVPSCPEWSVHELVGHLGHVHRWATTALHTEPDVFPEYDAGPVPDGAGIADWLIEGAGILVEHLEAADPSRPVFTFAAPHTSDFWRRRQIHETTMHRWDAENAHGPASEIPVGLAADGIDETLFALAPSRFDRAPLDEAGYSEVSVQLISTDHDLEHPGVWHLGFGTDGLTPRHVEAPADATLAASVEGLLLAAKGRVDLDRFEIDGDADLFATFIEGLTH